MKPFFQLMPMPLRRRPVTKETVQESPSGLLKLSWISTCVLPGDSTASEPRIPGQHGGVVQFVPVIVPSTNVDWAIEPGKMPKIGAGTPVRTWRYRSSYRIP